MSTGLDEKIVECIDNHYALFAREYEMWKGIEASFDDALTRHPDLPLGDVFVTLECRKEELHSQWVEDALGDIYKVSRIFIPKPKRLIAGPQDLVKYISTQIGTDLAKAQIINAFYAIRTEIRNYAVNNDALRATKEHFLRARYHSGGLPWVPKPTHNLMQMEDFECVMREVVDDPFTFGIDFDEAIKDVGGDYQEFHYTGTYKTPGSMIKSLRIFKNGTLKITFHTEDDLNDFMNIIPR